MSRVKRISDRQIEIDDCIAVTAGSDPAVDGLTLRLGDRKEHVRQHTFEWCQRGAIDPQTAQVGAFDEHSMRLNDLPGRHRVGWIQLATDDVVVAQQHDHVRHARLRQNIAVETRETVRSEDVAKQPVAREPRVHDAHQMIAGLSHKAPGKMARPAIVGIGRRPVPVRDRVAERDDERGSDRRRCWCGQSGVAFDYRSHHW